MKKLFPIILILAIVFVSLVVFAACTPEEKPSEGFELTKDMLSSYSVIVPEDCSDAMQAQANSLCSELKAVTGVTPDMKDDFVNDTIKEGAYEILIGKVNRKEAKDLYKNVRLYDLGYALVGKKIVIVGYTDNSIKNSIYRFKNEVLSSNESVILRESDDKIVKGSYEYDTLMINGTNINEYKIVYPSKSNADENTYASILKDWITEKTGYIIDVVVDNKSEKSDFEINLGNTNRVTNDMLAAKDAAGDDAYSVYGKDGLVWLAGKTTTIMRCALNGFCNLLTSDGKIDITSIKSATPNEIKLSILSYNVYFDLKEKNRDPEGVLTSIEERMPDIFNTVETTTEWFKLFDAKFGGTYTCVKGKPFDTSSDALYNAVFFKKDMFTLVDSGTRWFSDTPTRMSKYDISPHYKGMTYAILRDKASGAEFVYVSVHTSAGETRSEAIYRDNANLCREKQITVLKEQLEQFSRYPIILGGDFNAKPTSKSLTLLTSGTRYVDATLAAEEVIYTLPDNATHPTLCRDTGDNPYTEINENAQQIDYFFVTKDSITVQKFEEWDNPVNGKYPSDHIPVCAEITIFTN